jgi:hypothetical protein
MEENSNEILQDILELVAKTPNDQELGKLVRELINKINVI